MIPAAKVRELKQLPDDERPAILRGLVTDWPAVRAGRKSALELIEYLKRFDNGSPVDALLTAPEVDGQIFYNADFSGFNFHRNRLSVSAVAEQVLRYSQFPRSPAVAAQSALIKDCLPGFVAENRLALLEQDIQPRIWLGNKITTPAHVDEWNNIACVVAGHRRFTLFPPQQIGNLYIGPLDFAPTGAPMSLVTLRAPDLERFPRFTEAMAASQSADLGPGDAIYIPPLWWHHVESLDSFNVLVNYWWHPSSGDGAGANSAFDALLHAIVSIRSLPPETRAAWETLFGHYVFGDPASVTAHIPAHRLGILGELTAAQITALRAHLAKRLS